MGAFAGIGGPLDNPGRIGVKDGGIEAEGGLVGLEAEVIFAASEISGTEISGDNGGVGHQLLSFAVKANGLLVVALGEVRRAEIVDGLGVIGANEEGFLVAFASFVDGEQVMVGDAQSC